MNSLHYRLTKTELNSYIKEGNVVPSDRYYVEVENWTKWRLYINANKNYTHTTSTSSEIPPPKVIYAESKDHVYFSSKVSN